MRQVEIQFWQVLLAPTAKATMNWLSIQHRPHTFHLSCIALIRLLWSNNLKFMNFAYAFQTKRFQLISFRTILRIDRTCVAISFEYLVPYSLVRMMQPENPSQLRFIALKRWAIAYFLAHTFWMYFMARNVHVHDKLMLKTIAIEPSYILFEIIYGHCTIMSSFFHC